MCHSAGPRGVSWLLRVRWHAWKTWGHLFSSDMEARLGLHFRMHIFVGRTRLGSDSVKSLWPLDWSVCMAATCCLWKLTLHLGCDRGPRGATLWIASIAGFIFISNKWWFELSFFVAPRIKSTSFIRTFFVILFWQTCFWYTFSCKSK